MTMLGNKTFAALILAAAFALGGCAANKPIVTDTTLGSVIVYRNGVAYFERYAEPGQKELTLRVPTERVDDFLKSLSIIDESTGEPLPLSYPTVESFDGYVELTIALPQRPGKLKITYVTESPAWKPSYRVVLQDDGKANLQGWAVIDNVSGEDWNDIRVGVGSTAALSFRYDLHSVRLVEREMLHSHEQLAGAPPTGGSPYAVATRKVRIIGSLDQSALAQLESGEGGFEVDGKVAISEDRIQGSAGYGGSPEPKADRARRSGPKKQRKNRRGAGKRGKVTDKTKSGVYDDRYVDNLRLQAGNHRIRIEGYAQRGDNDPNKASFERADSLKQRLMAKGVPESNIDVVATGRMNSREAVRVLATDQEVGGEEQKRVKLAAVDTLPVGHAHFVSDEAMSIKKDHSAMVSTLNELTEARRVYFFDPVSQRGSNKFAFNAVRITNPSPYTLDAGPFTVYAKGQFLGEGLSDSILPKSTAFIPYALDRSIVADPQVDSREEIERLLTIQRGIVTSETRRIRRTKLTLSNRGKSGAEVYVRHKVATGYRLTSQSQASTAKVEKLGGAHLFRVDVPGGEAVELIIEEWTPLMKTVDIRTNRGVRDMGLFLGKRNLEPELKAQLDVIVKSHTDAANLQERIDVLDEQMRVFRTRIDEINVQLVTLRKVRQAGRLRQHLMSKMTEISERLQTMTMDATELKGNLMTLRISLQDKLADLSLERKPDEAAEETVAKNAAH
jgi:hypothetical protein